MTQVGYSVYVGGIQMFNVSIQVAFYILGEWARFRGRVELEQK